MINDFDAEYQSMDFYNFPSDRDEWFSYLPSRKDDREYEERGLAEDEELFEEYLKYLPIDGLDSE